MDQAIRAMTDEGSFRVIVLSAPEMVRKAVEVQEASGEVAFLFSQLLIGSVLVRQTMSPGHRVQLALHVDGQAILRADSFPNEQHGPGESSARADPRPQRVEVHA